MSPTALLAVALLATAPARAITLDHVLAQSSISELTWSRDGRRLAFTVTSPDTGEDINNADLWVMDERGARRLTRHPKNDFSPTFSPSGDTLAFVATRGTGDDAKPAIWMLSLEGGDPWPFGSYDESVAEVCWSPDGRWLAWVKLDTLSRTVREQRRKRWDETVEDERLQVPQLWVTDIATGRARRVETGRDYVWYVRWSPDSRQLAWLASPTGKPDDENAVDIAVAPVQGGAPHKLGVIGSAFAWSPDSRWLAWAGGRDRSAWIGKSDLWVAPASGGAAVDLTSGFDEDAQQPAWSPDSDTLYFHAAQGVTTVLAAVPRRGGGVTLGVDRRADAGALAVAGTGRAAWVQSQPESPPEVWMADHAWQPGREATAVNAAEHGLACGTTRAVRWTSTDQVNVEGLLLRPHGAPARAALKTLVLLHGGPYGERYALSFQPLAQWFAAHGYQVFMPNFRSSGGYGTAFMLRKRSDWGFQDWRDVDTGVDFLVKQGLADPHRLGVYGGSYGGYLSAWAITQTRRFDAACVIAGAVDLAAHYGQSDIHRYRAFDFGGPPWVTPENWRRSSPITYVANVKTPTLIIIGDNDPRVPYPQGQELYTALQALHVPSAFVHYPREGHGLREPRHRADQDLRMLAWFDRWVK
jgi:dipeptidyl aminopeptidase/acylaminoacyl peptidase